MLDATGHSAEPIDGKTRDDSAGQRRAAKAPSRTTSVKSCSDGAADIGRPSAA